MSIRQQRKLAQDIRNSEQLNKKNTGLDNEAPQVALVVWLESRRVLKLSKQYSFYFKVRPTRLVKIKPQIHPTTSESTFEAQGILQTSCIWPFSKLISNILDCGFYLQKRSRILQAANPPKVVHAIDADYQETIQTETTEADVNLIWKSVCSLYT